ncbi:CHASE2 domain-containing protein [Candidatus Aalborgicola defluviihabitans]|uniref:CHASE2 domain-containing protein n=1 Tax=Candidatus Aalborgicola defluviihabitans TaxID=3386187 RepID=UPI001D74837C|nr:CHASE2 domain-containing protein [Burkholderiales bacterium]
MLAGRLPPGESKGKIILVGTTAPVTEGFAARPLEGSIRGVESHANLLSGWLDGKVTLKPDYAARLRHSSV